MDGHGFIPPSWHTGSMLTIFDNLPEPGPVPAGTLRVLPLGGLGEVGRNMNVLETEGKLLIVDCGVLFPEEHQPGVDLILPDMSAIADRLEDIEALVLTHGHEDHIGAVPYLLKMRADIPVYASELTLALLEPKLKEHRLSTSGLHIVQEDEVVQLGPFEVEFVAVNHSIPDALAVFVRTEAGTVFITGDFKMDQLPLDGRLTDLRAFSRIGEEGVDLFLVDSTNAEVPGFVPPEIEIGPVLEQVFADTPGAVIVASFASHVHRVQQVFNAAAKTDRTVALVGRSMERNMAIAEKLGYLHVPDGTLESMKVVSALPPSKQVYMVTGSQGEPMSALGRVAAGNHQTLSVGPGDTVVFASSLIPGNEVAVNRVINALMARGAKVVHQGNEHVHVSGHAASGELTYCYNIVRPKNVMPVHGEVRHLIANGQLAVKTGVDPDRVMLADDGVAVDLKDGVATIAGAVPCELVYVDGSSVGELSEPELRERLALGSEGFISAFAVVDKEMGTVLAGPVIRSVGMAEDDSVFDDLLPDLERELKEAAAPGGVSTLRLQQVMRRVIGRWVNRKLRRRPVLVPVVVEQ